MGQEYSQADARADAARRAKYVQAPEDEAVRQLCEQFGYGAVMDAAARLWARKDPRGAFYIGGCLSLNSLDERPGGAIDVYQEH